MSFKQLIFIVMTFKNFTSQLRRGAYISICSCLILGSISRTESQELAATTLEFQNGLEGYDGTFERRVAPNGVADSGADFPEYYLDGTSFFENHVQNDITELIRFENIIGDGVNQIPNDAFIISAELIYHTGTDSNAASDGPWVIGQLIEAFSDDTFYEDLTSDDTDPSKAGPRSIVGDQLYAGYADISGLEIVSANVTEIVQNWVNGDTNHGISIFANDTSNGWQITTIGNEESSMRPKLKVTFTTEDVEIKLFQVSKSAIVKNLAPTVDGSTVQADFLDGADDIRDALVSFDDIFGEAEHQISSLDDIVKAELIFQTSGSPDFSSNADSDDMYFVHQMLVEWTPESDFRPTGLTEAEGEVSASKGELYGMGEHSKVMADVTEIVSNWKSGQPNYGFDVKAGAGDGWQTYLGGAIDESLRPMLRVITKAVPSVPILKLAVDSFEGDAPLTVNFDATGSVNSSGGELTYSWDFGDGSTIDGSIKQQHTYTEPGVYEARLTATNESGVSAEKLVSIKASGSPIAVLSANADMGPAPFILSLSAKGSKDSDGGAISYEWDLGDGRKSTTRDLEVTYASEGRKIITLTVTDDEGVQAQETHQIMIFPTTVKSISFQQGVSNYQGTFQKRVSFGGVSENGADVNQYYLDGRPQTESQFVSDTVDLLRFDDIFGSNQGQIPLGSKIVKALLTYTTGDDSNANSDGPWVIGRLVVGVDDSTTYEELDLDQSSPEGRGPRSVVDPKLISGFSEISNEEVVSADITQIVQAWSEQEDNEGVSIFTNDTTNGWQIKTIGNDDLAVRPKLTVFYLDHEEFNEYQFFVSQSSRISSVEDPLDGEFLGYEFVDGGPNAITEAMIQFNELFGEGADQVGEDERILSAKLIVFTGGTPDSSSNADSDDDYTVHQVLTEWDPTTTFGPTGPTIESGEIANSVGSFWGMGEKSISQVDVTPVLYNWQEKSEPNYGFNIKPGGEDGWQFGWPGLFDDNLVPQLIVITEGKIEPAGLNIMMSDGNLEIQFSGGSLQSATSVSGPWINIDTSSPHSESISDDQKFFRVIR